jgi:hypothetical protein
LVGLSPERNVLVYHPRFKDIYNDVTKDDGSIYINNYASSVEVNDYEESDSEEEEVNNGGLDNNNYYSDIEESIVNEKENLLVDYGEVGIETFL